MFNRRLLAVLLILAGAAIGYYIYASGPFKLGLDLRGGSHLVYEADVSNLPASEIKGSMESLRDVIERRINAFGVGEPLIQVEQSGLGVNAKHRLIVELPGVTDIEEAKRQINITPALDFRTERPDGPEKEAILAAYQRAQDAVTAGEPVPDDPLLAQDPLFVPSPLTGRYLKHTEVRFVPGSVYPSIAIEFNDEGAEIFSELTRNNIGKAIGIYLDGVRLSEPVVREEIPNGQAEISGQFTLEQAQQLSRNLNLGALPVPIHLVSTETIGATLGVEALERGGYAGLIGLTAVAIFMILWYRLPGLVSVISLAFYIILMLAIFKLLPVTITAAGIAGLILSFGMALDANILIFERMKEELYAGKNIHDAVAAGFSRAWLSIRDANASSLIAAIVLFWFGTSLIKGFALTLAIGLIVSLFTAITVTRTLLLALGFKHKIGVTKFLFGQGVKI